MVEAKKQSESNVTPIEKGTVQTREGTSKGLHPFDEMNRIFDQFFHRNWMHPSTWEWSDLRHIPTPFGGKMPRMDVIDRDHDILIRAELPGVNKDDVDVTMTGNTVTIKGTTSYKEEEKKANYYRSEIAHGAFQRSVVLPADVDVDKAESSFKDGILELSVPKMTKSSRKIPVH